MYLRPTDSEAILLPNALDTFILEKKELQKVSELMSRAQDLQERIERLKKL